MNKKNIFNFKEYIITIIVSIFVVLVASFALELELLFRCEKYINFNELNVENLSKFCTIEELEKKLTKNPDDVILNIRLGQMYASLNKLDKANDYYKNALRLSGRSNYTLYAYAMFCAQNDMYVFAATLAEELSGNNSKSNLFKAKIYEQIAFALDKKNDFAASVKSYQIAYKYAKSVGDLKLLKEIKEKYSSEYVKLADYHIDNNEAQEAIADLKNSLQIKENALANYKLGIIYLDRNPELAEKHINKAFFDDIYVVNPRIYNNLLDALMQESKILGNDAMYNYYNSRMTRFKKKMTKSYLYKDELVIEDSMILTQKDFLNKQKRILFFNLKNNTKIEMDSLFVKTELFVNGKKYIIEKKLLNTTNQLNAYEVLNCQDFVLPENIEFNNLVQNNDIFVRYYAKKQKDAPWVMVKIDLLKI